MRVGGIIARPWLCWRWPKQKMRITGQRVFVWGRQGEGRRDRFSLRVRSPAGA